MNRTAIILVLAMTALLVLGGCAANAQQNNQDDYYVPDNNYGGCGVSSAEDTNVVFEAVKAVSADSNEVF